MSSQATYQKLRGHLAYFKLTTAAERLPALLAANDEKHSDTQFLHDLLKAEVSATEPRRLDSRPRTAGLPSPLRLEDFDFDAQPTLEGRWRTTMRFWNGPQLLGCAASRPRSTVYVAPSPLAAQTVRLSSRSIGGDVVAMNITSDWLAVGVAVRRELAG